MKIFNIIDNFDVRLADVIAHGGTQETFVKGLTGELHIEYRGLQFGFPSASWFDTKDERKPTSNSNGALFQVGPQMLSTASGKLYPSTCHTCYDWMIRCLTFVRTQYNVEFEIGIGAFTHALYKENMTETELKLVIWPAVKAALQFKP